MGCRAKPMGPSPYLEPVLLSALLPTLSVSPGPAPRPLAQGEGGPDVDRRSECEGNVGSLVHEVCRGKPSAWICKGAALNQKVPLVSTWTSPFCILFRSVGRAALSGNAAQPIQTPTASLWLTFARVSLYFLECVLTLLLHHCLLPTLATNAHLPAIRTLVGGGHRK